MMQKSKLLSTYLQKEYPMVLIPEDNGEGYVVAFPDLPGCLSFGKDMNECIEMGQDAKKVWLSSMIEEGNHINEPNTIPPETLSKFIPKKVRREHGYILQTL